MRLVLTLLAMTLIGTARAQTDNPEFNIPAQEAASALAEFSAQARLQLLFDYDAVQGIRTQAITGRMSVADALTRLLSGSGLTFEAINQRTISVVRDLGVSHDPTTAAQAPARDTAIAAGQAPRTASKLAAAPGATRTTALDEIIVTAEKREQALQRSALAVTALASRVLERQQITDLKSVTTLIPNLQIGTSSTQAAFDLALRGIVSTNRTEFGDAAVAFHVDGFYSPRPQGATMLIYDLDRLEALRGPQGTLFGRNANAGVINVVTAKPELGEVFGAFDVTLGSYDLTRLKAHLNVPLSDTFALRGAAFVEQRAGYIDFLPGSSVTASTPRYDDSDKLAFRLSGLWEPNDAWTVFSSAERYADRGAGTIPVSLNPAPGHKLRSALITSPGELDMKNDTFHLRTDYRPSPAVELSYLFGWARMTRRNVSDQDVGLAQDPELRALPNPPLQPTYDEERRTDDSEFVSTQHEFQLKPLEAAKLDWILGAFYYREENSIRFDIDVSDDRGPVPGAEDAGDVRYSQSFLQPDRSLSAWAGFGQLTLHLTDAARASVGARYTEDTKQDRHGINIVCPTPYATIGNGGFNLEGIATGDIPFSPNPDSPVPVPGTCRITTHNDAKKDWSKVTYMARFEYDLGENLLGYALTNSGFKSGVIQDGGTYADPEQVVNYELGLKATLLDGSMAVNTVVFFSDYSDILRTRIENDASGVHQLVTRNATRASIYGIETEWLWKPTPDDVLQAVFTYLSSEYRDYPTVDFQYYVPTDPLTPVMNLRGNKLPFAPEYGSALVYEHYFHLPNGGRLAPRLQSKYQSEMFLTDFNRPSDRQRAYTRTDLGLRYETARAWAVEAFVQNIEDVAVKNNVDLRGNQPGAGGVPGFPGVARAFFDAPRTYGLRASYRFE
ncbi:MAG TPA: TonB-dependent receptor [Steroidobacteraceae bacterium]|jgi:iron complex outermembrane receptor protein|nr:TonB-dependent receptor [Steroidobacteraceae bacterium]